MTAPAAAGTADGTATALAARQTARAGTTWSDAVRLADQATFGPTEALIARIGAIGPAGWIAEQLALPASRYSAGGGDAVHRAVQALPYCQRPENQAPGSAPGACWTEMESTQPLLGDFYRNAVGGADQLRQRVALALQQTIVVSSLDLGGTYGFRRWHNMLLDNAFGNWRDLLRQVVLSPVMGDYLDLVNNDAAAPNENFARELLQLFAIGTCELAADGRLSGDGGCRPSYDTATVRAYARALTGWTYPLGGSTRWGCLPAGTNCRYYGGDMVPAASRHDSGALTLLSGVRLAAGHTAPQALEAVLDSLVAHPNAAPFLGRRLIQHLVLSNPSPAYVGRVAQAFDRGSFAQDGRRFGSGRRGDLAATVAAILLDAEARQPAASRSGGRLREPALFFTGVLRALGGTTDGAVMGWWFGAELQQHLFRAPSVFGFYTPDYPVPGGTLAGPAFGIHNSSAALQRLNYLSLLLDWGGQPADPAVRGSTGTSVQLGPFMGDAGDPGRLVDRLARLLLGAPLDGPARARVVDAVAWWTPQSAPGQWAEQRVRTAAYLVFASPRWQVVP